MNSYKDFSKARLSGRPARTSAAARPSCGVFSIAVFAAGASFLLGAMSPPLNGQTSASVVGGTARDSASGKPVAGAQIVAQHLGNGTARSTLTNTGGLFAFTNLEPGRYEFSASKNGFQKASAKIEVVGTQAVRVDLPLLAAVVQPLAENADAAPMTQRERDLLDRIDRLERRLAAVESKDPGTASANTATPTPATSAAVPSPKADQPETAAAASIPEPLQSPEPAPESPGKETPFAFGDFSWLNGNSRSGPVLDTKFFTPEVRFDTHFMTDFNQPKDHSLGGSTEMFRSGEFQEEQISVGGDFHWKDVRGRVLYMMGMFATTTPRNDASTAVGQWDLKNAYRYVSEAWGGYHFNVNHGLNVDAGIFVSYIGLFSYYNFDNWAYQPSFVSSNTPWFFNGLRIQWFPTKKLKIEPWIINGWQSYARFNGHHGFGGQILYRPTEWLSIVSNNYGNGTDTLGNPNRTRIHTDNSVEVRYFNRSESTGISKMAFSLTGDAGCEYGGGVTCHGGNGGPKQSFLGFMLYNRIWFHKDLVALTMGGGKMNNPGRYLTLLPPINGADAASGSPYFTANSGDKAHMWDASINLQYMPRKYITWWLETGYRHSDVPYWSGRGGITPPGGNNGAPSQFACSNGAPSGTNDLATAFVNCGGPGSVWFPDLRKGQASVSAGVMVKF